MNFELGISITATIFGFISFLISAFCIKNFRDQKYYLELHTNEIDILEEELNESLDLLQESQNHISDQARRIAWLETRFRHPQAHDEKDSSTRDIPLRKDRRLSIAERRQKILKLSEQEQDSKVIAEKLGLMPGEVELILNLNRRMPSYI